VAAGRHLREALSMIPKSGNRFSDKIMLRQNVMEPLQLRPRRSGR
jgi:hypothetical protein